MSSTPTATIRTLNEPARRRARHATIAAWLVALPLAGAACQSDGEIIEECVGSLVITVPLTSTPAKLRVELRRGDSTDVVVLDECSGVPSPLLLERRSGALIVDDGSFGYTPPPRFDLTVKDLGTCAGSTATVVAVEDVAVPPNRGLCDVVAVTLPGT